MSKPRYYWYSMVKKVIMYPHLLDKGNPRFRDKFLRAIDEANRQTLGMQNGVLRLKAVDDILISKTRTYEGVAQELFYSKETVIGWVSGYIRLVGKLAGF